VIEADFQARLQRRIDQHGPLCLGIDPSADALATCGLPNTAQGALDFGIRMLAAAAYRLAIVKPQSAFFERFGSPGIRALEELITQARRREVLVLLDAKRGDIDTTAEAYAEAYFSPSSPLKVDAVTLHPYLGLRALAAAIRFAVRNGGGVFIVVRSSNPEGQALQTARLADGRTVADSLCADIAVLNRELGGAAVGPIGAVVGATCDDAAAIVAALPHSFILAPGVGVQGATIKDVGIRMGQARGRILPSTSRSILASGCGPRELSATIRQLQAEARALT
jgi:orotidine-5'-phosphate decarboxylase